MSKDPISLPKSETEENRSLGLAHVRELALAERLELPVLGYYGHHMASEPVLKSVSVYVLPLSITLQYSVVGPDFI